MVVHIQLFVYIFYTVIESNDREWEESDVMVETRMAFQLLLSCHYFIPTCISNACSEQLTHT